MAKREFWEDIIVAIDNIPDNDSKQKQLSAEQDENGHLLSDTNPFNQSGQNLNEFESKALHNVFKEIEWDKINIEIADDQEWEKKEICDPSYEINDKEKIDYNACKEEFDKIKDEIEGDWKETTIEKCAWYQSYHYLPRTYWGIHILENCWISYAKKIYKYNPHSKTKNDAMKSAFLFLFCHELFHYITDNASSVIEVSLSKANMYTDYSKKVYKVDFSTVGAKEEALANRYLYGRNEYCRINKHFLYHMLKGMPKGYCDFDEYSGNNFWVGRRKLINQIYYCLSLPTLELPIEQVFEILNQKHYSSGHRIPIWLHTKKGVKSRITFK